MYELIKNDIRWLMFYCFWTGFMFAFSVWYLVLKKKPKKKKSKLIKGMQELYCFECEIEMPVKEKNGRLYCSNCGLKH